jgi:UPF0755 protein
VDPFSDDSIEINIPKGFSAKKTGALLAEKNLIHNSLFFTLYARFMKKSASIKSGVFMLSPSMTLAAILDTLSAPVSAKPVVTVTFPEGFDLAKIAARLEKMGVVKAGDFLKAFKLESLSILKTYKTGAFTTYKGADNYEGLIFPDTYEFFKDSDPRETAQRLLKKHVDFMAEYPDKGPLGLSRYECLILASIIEKECSMETERPMAARVFLNRLEKNIKLESCATVIYALIEEVSVLTNEDLKFDSPYNTYIYAGLPPGPICCAGKSSMHAVFNPSLGDWLYFVANGSGGHNFSATLKKHNYYKGLYKRKLRELKRQSNKLKTKQ